MPPKLAFLVVFGGKIYRRSLLLESSLVLGGILHNSSRSTKPKSDDIVDGGRMNELPPSNGQ